MQFEYRGRVVNLLDTPATRIFPRTPTACSLRSIRADVIDAAKGVEEQTIKLLNVCRMRSTPSSPS